MELFNTYFGQVLYTCFRDENMSYNIPRLFSECLIVKIHQIMECMHQMDAPFVQFGQVLPASEMYYLYMLLLCIAISGKITSIPTLDYQLHTPKSKQTSDYECIHQTKLEGVTPKFNSKCIQLSNQHCTKIVSLCTSALRLYLLPLRAHILQVQDAHLGHLVSFSLRTLHAVHESRDLILQVLYIKDPSVTDNVPFPQMFALLQTHNAVSLHFTDS